MENAIDDARVSRGVVGSSSSHANPAYAPIRGTVDESFESVPLKGAGRSLAQRASAHLKALHGSRHKNTSFPPGFTKCPFVSQPRAVVEEEWRRRGRLPGRAGGSNARAGHLSAAGQLRRLALYAARALSMFSGCQRPAPEASLRAPWVLKGWRRRLRGARGCPPKPEYQVKTRRCFFRGKGRFPRR